MTAYDPRSGPLMAMVGSMAMEGYKIGDAGGARSSGVRALAAYGPPGREPIIVSGSDAFSVVRSASEAWAAAAGKLWEGGDPPVVPVMAEVAGPSHIHPLLSVLAPLLRVATDSDGAASSSGTSPWHMREEAGVRYPDGERGWSGILRCAAELTPAASVRAGRSSDPEEWLHNSDAIVRSAQDAPRAFVEFIDAALDGIMKADGLRRAPMLVVVALDAQWHVERALSLCEQLRSFRHPRFVVVMPAYVIEPTHARRAAARVVRL